jgi:non-specific serine/threonine protein kinase
LEFAERAEPKLLGPEQVVWLERLEIEYDNLRAALEWSMARGDAAENGLRLAVTLRRFWELHGHFAEGRRWLEGFLTQSAAAPTALRGAALNGAGILAYRQGDYEQVSTQCTEALVICEGSGDKRGTAEALHFLAHLLQVKGEYARASEMMERSVALYREADDTAGMANSVDCLGEIARSRGDYGAAATLTSEALTLYTKAGNVRGRAHALHNLGYIALRQGNTKRARALFQESLGLALGQGIHRDVVFALAGLVGASAGDMQPHWGVRLFGAVEALLSRIEIRLEPAERADFERSVSDARARMTAEAFAAAWAEGRAMTLEQAIEYALAGDQPRVQSDTTG